MTRLWVVSLSLICVIFLAACAPAGESVASQPTETVIAAPDFAPTLQSALATEMKIDGQDVKLVSAEKVQWRDSCLGVQRKGMMCMEVITPGYLITFETPQGIYEAHTNEDGTVYVFVPQEATPTPPTS